ncbi:MAG TPA: flagellar basal-body rod protein FlgF [Phycisphaerae bacterium]|nr:flagellar basal-body rod protein FlgF [Phycisphaerae bacterium]
MVYGIYQSAAGLQLNQYRQEVLANNLANLETAGFKHDLTVVRERPLAMREPGGRPDWSNRTLNGLTGGSYVAPTYTSFAQGPLEHTGGRLDVALFGSGFFTVQDGDAIRYTRDGRFVVNPNGELTTVSGHIVLGEDGSPIRIPAEVADKVTITAGGDVRAGDLQLGRLAVVDFENKQALRKIGGNLFDAGQAEPVEAQATLQPGFYEGSTVEPTKAMVSMIEVSRAYELNATLVGLADSTLGRAVNDIARLG